MIRSRRYDVVVIGAGTAGLTAAVRLAQAGAQVCLVAKGIGSTHLAPGWIDVLGYAPVARGGGLGPEPVGSPHEAIERLTLEHPQHPYALIGAELVGDALRWLIGTVADGPLPGYRYGGGIDRNLLVPTAVGTLKPTAAVPETFAAGSADGLGRVRVVGVPALRDFHPQLCAANLAAAGIDARAASVEVETDRADASTLGLARQMDDPASRAAFAARLAPLVRGADTVGLPAMLGMSDPHGVLVDLEQRLGRRVFEIPTLPPSVPGMRLYEVLRHALRAAGGTLAMGAGVVSHERLGDRITSISTATAGSNTTYAADHFVLASGGFHSGAITLDSRWQTRDQVLGLPLAGLPAEGEPRFVPEYFDEQPMARVGVAVDEHLRALGADNVHVAGASLPGAVPWREGSGEGIALASGYRVAEVIAAALGIGPATRVEAVGLGVSAATPPSSGAAAPAIGAEA
jgi:glycerol-3-phosphate dehydrogenase subunit B